MKNEEVKETYELLQHYGEDYISIFTKGTDKYAMQTGVGFLGYLIINDKGLWIPFS